MIDFTFSDMLVDMHVHTLRTHGGMSTIRENLAMARKRGLDFIVVIDHASDLTPVDILSLSQMSTDAGVEIITGCNVDSLVCSDSKRQLLDTSPVRFRSLSLDPSVGDNMISSDSFLARIEEAVNFYGIDYLCNITEFTSRHIPSAEHRQFSSYFAKLCADRLLTVELTPKPRSDTELFMLTHLVEDCADKGVKFAFGSDAYYCEQVGRMENIILFAESFNLRKAGVINCDKETLRRICNSAINA